MARREWHQFFDEMQKPAQRKELMMGRILKSSKQRTSSNIIKVIVSRHVQKINSNQQAPAASIATGAVVTSYAG
jgi:hypothetical protein